MTLNPTEEMRTPSQSPPTFRKVVAQPKVVDADTTNAADQAPEPRTGEQFDKPSAAPTPAQERSVNEQAGEPPQLVSSSTKAVVEATFDTLTQTVAMRNGRTLEDLVQEMLRPMLKAWLDDNLPEMVERLVRAEIERLSCGRGER